MPTEILLPKHEVVVERSVLAAIVDIAFGDVEHESIGVLYGRVDQDRKQVIVTDCESMEREPGTLDPFSVKLTEVGLLEAVEKKSKGNDLQLVGWFHTHLYDQPLPSADDAKVHEGIQGNSQAAQHAVGLICCLDAVNGGATSDCRRVTFTAFRGKSHEQVKRVTWSVRETPALSPGAVQCCFNTVREMEKENRKLCNDLAGALSLSCSQSCIKRKWLQGMWENYLIRLLQGTLPLLLDQLEQSRRNLRIQRAQITARLEQQRMKGLSSCASVRDAVGSSSVKEIRSSAKNNSGQSTHRMNLSLTSSRAAASSMAESGGGGGGASKRIGAFRHSDPASAGRMQDKDGDLREGGKERGSRPAGTRPEGCRPYSKAAAVRSSGNSPMAKEARNSNAGGAVDANSSGSDSNPDALAGPHTETGSLMKGRGAFKSLKDDIGESLRARPAEKKAERAGRAEKRRRRPSGDRSKSVNEPQQPTRRSSRQPQRDDSPTSDEQSGPASSGDGDDDFQASDTKKPRNDVKKYGLGKS